MVQWTSQITARFDHPIEHVWNYVSDVRNQDHWVAGMSDSSIVEGDQIGLGAEIAATNNGRERIVARITRFDAPHSVAWHAPDADIAYLTEISLASEGDATRFTYTVTLTSRNAIQALFFGPLRPLSNIKARSMLKQEIAHLRTALADA